MRINGSDFERFQDYENIRIIGRVIQKVSDDYNFTTLDNINIKIIYEGNLDMNCFYEIHGHIIKQDNIFIFKSNGRVFKFEKINRPDYIIKSISLSYEFNDIF